LVFELEVNMDAPETDSSKKSPRHTGRFPKGSSGNPRGRPPGSRNKASLIIESLLEGEAEALGHTAIRLAREGSVPALKLCLERLIPPRTEQAVTIPLRNPNTASEVREAIADIWARVGAGDLTPIQAEVLSRILSVQLRAIEIDGFESRLAQLEQQAEERKNEKLAPGELRHDFTRGVPTERT
jgi:uncharacterized protein DUF5681